MFISKITRKRVIDVLTVKAALMWLGLLTYEATPWEAPQQVEGVAWVLTCVTTVVLLWLRVDEAFDLSYRRAYRAAVLDMRREKAERAERRGTVSQPRKVLQYPVNNHEHHR